MKPSAVVLVAALSLGGLTACGETGDTTAPSATQTAANGEVFRWFGPDGIKVPGGISVDRIAGSTEIAIYTKKVI